MVAEGRGPEEREEEDNWPDSCLTAFSSYFCLLDCLPLLLTNLLTRGVVRVFLYIIDVW